METHRIEIEGMCCEHCVAKVKGALDGVEGLRLDTLGMGEASVSFDPDDVRLEEILAAISSAGYSAK